MVHSRDIPCPLEGGSRAEVIPGGLGGGGTIRSVGDKKKVGGG